MNEFDNRLNIAWWALRIGLGLWLKSSDKKDHLRANVSGELQAIF